MNVGYEHKVECERYGAGGSVHRAFVILKDAGTIPEKKGAFLTEDQLDKFVREVIACRPASTQIIVCRLTWDDDLWVDDGREMIEIDDAIADINPEEFRRGAVRIRR